MANPFQIILFYFQVCFKKPDIHTVEGDHESFIQGNSAKTVAKVIMSCRTPLEGR